MSRKQRRVLQEKLKQKDQLDQYRIELQEAQKQNPQDNNKIASLCEQIAQIFQDNAQHHDASNFWSKAGDYYSAGNRYDRALSCFQNSLKEANQSNIPEDLSMLYNDIGRAYEALGDFHEALLHYQKANTYSKDRGEDGAIYLHNIGKLLQERGLRGYELSRKARSQGDRGNNIEYNENKTLDFYHNGKKSFQLILATGAIKTFSNYEMTAEQQQHITEYKNTLATIQNFHMLTQQVQKGDIPLGLIGGYASPDITVLAQSLVPLNQAHKLFAESKQVDYAYYCAECIKEIEGTIEAANKRSNKHEKSLRRTESKQTTPQIPPVATEPAEISSTSNPVLGNLAVDPEPDIVVQNSFLERYIPPDAPIRRTVSDSCLDIVPKQTSYQSMLQEQRGGRDQAPESRYL